MQVKSKLGLRESPCVPSLQQSAGLLKLRMLEARTIPISFSAPLCCLQTWLLDALSDLSGPTKPRRPSLDSPKVLEPQLFLAKPIMESTVKSG